ncbi:MAG: hypothetical protein UV57_C0009G0022 [Parcubacteria group bacterium GW2011_GWD2_43_10]|nr:MAG: hypothetical protein UV57_C0009G0022 [Parcubacteria group bacterium GW2011_GWD2_43_10]KKT25614.1 MAG: hypothetical protein UW12_C0045G0004 [Parcubacteria group bacterium GW2011_GWF1_43_9]
MDHENVEKNTESVQGERLFTLAIEEASHNPTDGSPEPIWDIDWDEGPDHSHSD